MSLLYIYVRQLYYQIQRYKFESNSQQKELHILRQRGCIIKYKDTNLKAIHNKWRLEQLRIALYYQIQRYKFESNSQRIGGDTLKRGRCIIKYKDTNLKAIHNIQLF